MVEGGDIYLQQFSILRVHLWYKCALALTWTRKYACTHTHIKTLVARFLWEQRRHEVGAVPGSYAQYQVCGSYGYNIRGQQYWRMQAQGESKTEMGGIVGLHLTPDTGDNSPWLLETDRTRDVYLFTLEKPSHAEKWTFLLETPGKYSITKVTSIQWC